MACCLIAPSHYLNQCWLIISGVLQHAHQSNFIGYVQEFNPKHESENFSLKFLKHHPGANELSSVVEPYTKRCLGAFQNTYELSNLRALKFSLVNKIHVFQCMGEIFCVEFQSFLLKFHTKYLTHALKDIIFIQHWNFKSSDAFASLRASRSDTLLFRR